MAWPINAASHMIYVRGVTSIWNDRQTYTITAGAKSGLNKSRSISYVLRAIAGQASSSRVFLGHVHSTKP